MLRRILPASRYLIIFAVFGSFVAAVLLLGFGMIYELRVIFTTPVTDFSSTGSKQLVVSLIEIIDLFLLGTGFYLIALGLYELFIDDQLPVPTWLEIHSFDDLKGNLIGIIIVVMGVTFLSQLLKWDGERDLLAYGVAVGLVIFALSYFISVKGKKDSGLTEKDAPADE